MKLYGRPQSGYTKKVRIALAEKGLLEDVPLVHVSKEESKEPNHLARHPLGLVPVLEHEGRFLAESTAIITFLDAYRPEPSLFPSDPWLRAEVTFWDRYFDQASTPPVRVLMFGRERGDLTASQEAKAKAELGTVFEYLDRSLSGRSFLVGDCFTLADLAFMSRLQLLPLLELELPESLPNVRAWRDRLEKRTSWSAVM
ncbi:MAG: glutathione S-transferase family protein [Planctomycetota bacterium]